MESQKRIVLFGLLLGFGTVTFDSSALSIALPSVGNALHSSISELQWVVNSYVIGFAGFLLTGGKLADRYGSRRTMVWGTVGFGVFSVLCGASTNVSMLIVTRFFQGASGAILTTATFALAGSEFKDSAARAKAMGMLNFCGSVGVSSGLVVGGLLVQHFGWRWIFFCNLAVAATVLYVTRAVGNVVVAKVAAIDFRGQVLSVLTLTALAAALIEGTALGWTSLTSIVLISMLLLCALTFLLSERRSALPMVPLELFRVRSFASSVFGIVMWRFAFYGLLFLFGLYFQGTLRYSTQVSGLALLPLMVSMMLGNLASPFLITRLGSHKAACGGYVLCTIGSIFISSAASAGYWAIMLGVVVMVFGAGVAVPALGHSYVPFVAASQIGIASGVYNAAGQTGMLVGIGVLTPLATVNGVHGLRMATLITSVTFLATVVVIAIWVSRGDVLVSKDSLNELAET